MNFKLASVGIFLLMVLAIGLVLKKSGREGESMRNLRSRYHPVSVEGFACRVQGVGVEFEAMDVHKAKMGAITLGGFNVLEVKDLRLTLFEGGCAAGGGNGGKSAAEGAIALPNVEAGKDQVEAIRAALLPRMKFAGLEIAGLRIYRARESAAEGEAREEWIRASKVSNSGAQVRLEDVVLCEAGGTRVIGAARLAMKDGYYLEYGKDFAERIRIL